MMPDKPKKTVANARVIHGEILMDDLYAINVAKSEIRDCFNFSDVSRLLAIADPDLVNFSLPGAINFSNYFKRYSCKNSTVA